MRRVISLGGAQYLSLATQLITGPLLALALGPDDRGLLAVVLVIFALTPPLMGLGAGAVFRATVARRLSAEAAYARLLRSSALSVALSTIAGLATALFLFDSIAIDERVAIAVLIASSGTACYRNAVLSGSVAAGSTSIVTRNSYLLGITTLALIASLFFLGTLSVATACWAYTFTTLITLVPTLRRFNWIESGASATPTWRYALASVPGQVGEIAFLRVDQLLVAALLGFYANGLYAVGASYAFMLYPLAHTLALSGEASRLKDDSTKPSLRRRLLPPLVILGAGAVMAIIADPFIRMLFGSEYLDSAQIALVLIPAVAMFGLSVGEIQRNLSVGRAARNSIALSTGILAIVVLAIPLSTLGLHAMPFACLAGSALTLTILLALRFADRAPKLRGD